MKESIGAGVRMMPQDPHAEQCLLGSVLLDPGALLEIADIVSASDFFLKSHAAIWTAMAGISRASGNIDVITLLDEIDRQGIYESRDAALAYLEQLSAAVPSALNVKDYANIVIEKSLARRLIEFGDELSQKAYSGTEKADALLAYAEGELHKISMGRDSRKFRGIRELMNEVIDELSELARNPESFEGIQTGFSEVDRILGGINKSDLVIIGARPGMGKTSLSLNIAANVARKTKKKVAIFSLEMSGTQIASRLISAQAMVETAKMRTGALTDGDWGRISTAVQDLYGANILIDDTVNLTVTEMKAKLRREKDVGLVIVDYLGLMQGERFSDNRVLEIGDITRGLKLMAKELDCPIIVASQLSRGVESRSNKSHRPMLSDLRDSGSIEQDADSVMFIYRKEAYQDQEGQEEDSSSSAAPGNASVAEIIVAKNRHGSTGAATVAWLSEYTLFRTIEKFRDAPNS